MNTTPKQNQSETAKQEFWQAMSTLMAFQKQAPPLIPVDRNGEIPLSFTQERLWFLDRLESGNFSPYNEPIIAVQIEGNLNIPGLEQSLNAIVQRHEILRTSFSAVKGQPVQVIHPEMTLNLSVVDLRDVPSCDRKIRAMQLLQESIQKPFNLEEGQLLRAKLVQLDQEQYFFLITIHHIVCDAWSTGVLLKELTALYKAFCAGKPSPLLELPVQYSDFAVWQRQWLQSEFLETQLNYWKQQLADSPAILELPTDRPRPPVQTYRGSKELFKIDLDLTQQIKALSQHLGTTLFTTLLAAFQTLLYRYSRQQDIVVGSPFANRNRSEIEDLIGFFANTLVLRTNFADNPSFTELLAQVRQTTLKAYEHQDVPFEQVVEALQPERSLSHSPLFQVMFVLQNAPMGELELPGVTLSELHPESTIAKFDLYLSMTETDQGLVGSWEYNTDLFDGSNIERMAGHFQN